MSYKIMALMPLIISFFASAETKQSHSKVKCDLNIYLKELSYPKTKPVVAATTVSLGTYLLYDAIKTTIDLQKTDQHNGSNGIALNAVIAAGLIGIGSYFLKQTWDEQPLDTFFETKNTQGERV